MGIFKKSRPDTDIWKSPVVLELRKQIQEMEQRYRAQMEFFVNFPEVVKNLTGALTVGQVNAAMSRGISALLDSKQIGIFMAHGKDKLRLVDGVGFREELRGRFDCSVEDSRIKPLLEYRGVSFLKDYPEAQRFFYVMGLTVELTAPVWYGGRFLGLLTISKPTVEKTMGMRTLAMLADMMSVSLHAAGLVQEIRKRAERDALTGLANRRSLMERITAELQRCKSYESKLSLVMIDVDNFKHYNDRNGHGAGDIVLKKIAALMEGSIRRTDMAARYGGEEFTLVLQGSDDATAFHTAERIRKVIVQAQFPDGEHQPLGFVSISMGVATFPDDADTVEALFKAADSALYLAKEQGRNRVIVYSRAQSQEK
jgi:diguanylate cyclase (GGDEF)-like protein